MKQQTIALVVALNDAGDVLLLKRHIQQHCGGLWSFPGGKVESRESPQTAATRELQEETNLIGSAWQCLGEHRFVYPDRVLNFILFQCECVDISNLKAESEHAWVEVAQLSAYPMPEANHVLLQMLAGKRGTYA